MPPLINNTGIKLMDINEIIIKKNVRLAYTEIKELAESIISKGQLQPVVTNSKGELIIGHRRYYAFEYIRDVMGSNKQIEVKIIDGNETVIQLVENLQRVNLTAEEEEAAYKGLINEGYTPVDIAKKLSVRLSRVSDILKAGETREAAKSAGADTSDISTSAMSQLRSLEGEDLKEAVAETKEEGGTVKAATVAAKKRKEPPVSSYVAPVIKQTPVIPVEKEEEEKHVGMQVFCNAECRFNVSGKCGKDSVSINSFGICEERAGE